MSKFTRRKFLSWLGLGTAAAVIPVAAFRPDNAIVAWDLASGADFSSTVYFFDDRCFFAITGGRMIQWSNLSDPTEWKLDDADRQIAMDNFWELTA